MSEKELIDLIQQHDPAAKKLVFESFYSRLAAISARYCKNQTQAEEFLNAGFHNCFTKLSSARDLHHETFSAALTREFIKEAIAFIKNIRSEYYVSSTVYATEPQTKNYDLFHDNEKIDFRSVDDAVLLKAVQQLVPAQRLVFNLHVIEGYNLEEVAELLEASAPTVKSNLEKARFNVQKNIEKSLKSIKP